MPETVIGKTLPRNNATVDEKWVCRCFPPPRLQSSASDDRFSEVENIAKRRLQVPAVESDSGRQTAKILRRPRKKCRQLGQQESHRPGPEDRPGNLCLFSLYIT